MSNRWPIVIAAMVTTFLAAMEATVVGTAMPSIVADLGNLELYVWVITAYLVTSTITTPMFGKLADLYGRKRTLVGGILLFLAGAVLSGLSATMLQLILFRSIQGLGAGCILPVTMTILGDLFTTEERARYQGLLASVWGVAGLLGPPLGSVLVSAGGWPWVFYINVPVGLVALVLLLVYLREQVPAQKPALDWAGAALLTVSVTTLLLPLALLGRRSWTDPWVLGLLAVAAVAAAAFVRVEARAPEPLLPLDLFRIPVLRWSNLANLFFGINFMAGVAFAALFVQGVLGGDVRTVGLVMVAMSVGWPISATLSARVILRWGTRRLIVSGQVVQLLAILGLAALGTQTPLAWVAVVMVVLGVGFGLASPSYMISIQNAVAWNRRGVATSTLTFVRALGQTVGGAVLGLVQSHLFAARAGNQAALGTALLEPASAAALEPALVTGLRLALHHSLQVTFALAAVGAVAGVILALCLPGRINVHRAPEPGTLHPAGK